MTETHHSATPWAERWAAALEPWDIPDEILAAAPASPWVWPASRFQRAADREWEIDRLLGPESGDGELVTIWWSPPSTEGMAVQ